ncbi:hypothetical protein EAS61_30805 [Bradyrhizobium zhanjiangense]|uniref:Uncharacterized protein n=1 Tax=Bradyrhizobium zhanjiangense TaxID=1325107 RepID=A0A4Q0QCB6_9BRAD|nr:hypothetical protein EAS61_30805 [Bradyrhizobium zhanjiangense]
MFEYKAPLPETEAAFLFVRAMAGVPASFRHDLRSACMPSWRQRSAPWPHALLRALIQLNAVRREFMGHSQRGQ